MSRPWAIKRTRLSIAVVDGNGTIVAMFHPKDQVEFDLLNRVAVELVVRANGEG